MRMLLRLWFAAIMFRLLSVFFIFLCSFLHFSMPVIEARQIDSIMAEPLVTSIRIPDSLNRIPMTDTDIIALNSEKTVDVLIKTPGMQIHDLGSLGQYSSVGYNGAGKNNVIPILNGLPLTSESFGTWNWHDIPYYIISSIQLNERTPKNILGAFSTVNIQSKYFAPAIPFSNVNYRIGDFGFSHVDVTLARKFGVNKSFYASGSSEKFPGSLAENRYRGSNFWIQLNHSYKGISFTWQTLISDKNMREISEFPEQGKSVSKEMRHSHNVKMATLKLGGIPGIENGKLLIYYSQIKDQAEGSLLYSDDFINNDKKLGFLLEKTGYTIGNWNLGYHLSGNTSKIKSNFWQVQDRINTAVLSIDANYDFGTSYTLSLQPEFYARTKSSGVPVFGEIVFSYNPSNNFSTFFSAARHGRFRSLAEEAMERGTFTVLSDKPVDNIERYRAIIKYYFKNISFKLSPFFYTNRDPAIYIYNPGENVPGNISSFNHISKPDINSISNGGFGIWMDLEINKNNRLHVNYTYQGGKKSYIVSPPHTAFVQLSMKNIEDRFTSLDIDTELNINVFFRSKGQHLAYLPLFQQIVQTDNEISSVAGIKARGSAKIKTLSLFYEIDLLSKSGYQYILGYPNEKRKIRVGLSWDFYN